MNTDGAKSFDPHLLQADFPILAKHVHGKQLVYLDNAATSQKPVQVLQAIENYYTQHNANVHRGVHQLSDESTSAWVQARQTIAHFLGADQRELIMVRNTTEATNAVVYGWALHHLQADDVILTTQMEHHSNLVVWQQVAAQTGAQVVYVKVTANGELDQADFQGLVDQHAHKLRLVALTHVSNALGTLNPISALVAAIKDATRGQERPPRILLDAAQSAPHLPLNFAQLGVDFLVASGHKMLGPMGAGILLVRRELLESNEMKPWLFGGGMISSVTEAGTEFHDDVVERFTAGTPDVASAVGLAAACEYLSALGMTAVEQHDRQLVAYALEQLGSVPELNIVGPGDAAHRVGSVAFLYQGVHAHDVAQVLDSQGIAVRSGHHCTMPLHLAMGWQATVRASFQVYTTTSDIDALVAGFQAVATTFSLK
jgi:cysteine desulfurase/selenocysteine lyase